MGWTFDPAGPDTTGLAGPVELVRRGLVVPPRTGLYVITAGDCLAHVGTSGNLRGRIGTLARLGTHRGSAEVLCAAHCTRHHPVVWWEEHDDIGRARQREREFKHHYGEPPQPRPPYESCVNGAAVLDALVVAAGANSWEAGYIEAVLTVGEKLSLLFERRFERLWSEVRVPPGPWDAHPTATAPARTAPIDLPVEEPTAEEFQSLIRRRRRQVAGFLEWAAERECSSGSSLRAANRHDITDAKQVLPLFADEPWWGLVVFTAFGSAIGTEAVADALTEPIPPNDAQRFLDSLELPRGAVGHHRIQPGHRGAKTALVAACTHAKDFERILHRGVGFHDRYRELRALGAKQWGRTTCFDLLLRAGALGIGGARYAPEIAYLADSTGPGKGFEAVFGLEITKRNVAWCEGVLRRWSDQWFEVAETAGVRWPASAGEPYGPADFENALCVYQEGVSEWKRDDAEC